jgi:hypothetical protein
MLFVGERFTTLIKPDSSGILFGLANFCIVENYFQKDLANGGTDSPIITELIIFKKNVNNWFI